MKSSELSNGENRIALRQLLQNRKLRHLYDVIIWVQDGNCKKWLEMISALVRCTVVQYNQKSAQSDKTVGRDSFLSPQTPKIQVFRGRPAPRGPTASIF